MIARAFSEMELFHALDLDEKQRLRIDSSRRGYIHGQKTIHTNIKSIICSTLVAATVYGPDHVHAQLGEQIYGPNKWPESLPGLKETIEEYLAAMTALGKHLLPIWALALDLPPKFFNEYFSADSDNYLRMNYFPPQPDLPDSYIRLPAHKDGSFLTLLPQANTEGLEILGAEGDWYQPQRLADCILVNLGEFLERWSNGRFRSATHRVISPRTKHRYSMGCFFGPDLNAVAECLTTCCAAGSPPQYPPQSYADWQSSINPTLLPRRSSKTFWSGVKTRCRRIWKAPRR